MFDSPCGFVSHCGRVGWGLVVHFSAALVVVSVAVLLGNPMLLPAARRTSKTRAEKKTVICEGARNAPRCFVSVWSGELGRNPETEAFRGRANDDNVTCFA
jgi:hypothetical protein